MCKVSQTWMHILVLQGCQTDAMKKEFLWIHLMKYEYT